MATGIPYNEAAVLAATASGDERAFRQLFDQYWDHIYAVAYSITRSPALAEDIVQEIFIKVWTNREQLIDIERFDNYLFILARNHIYNELRKAAREDKLMDNLVQLTTGDHFTADQQLILKESQELMHATVNKLPLQQQAVYKLSRDEGLKYEEIAERLQISKATVRNHMIKALRSIREQLASHSGRALFIICMLETFRTPQ